MWTRRTQDREHRLVKPGRRYGHRGHGIVSTVSLNRDEMAGAENTGWRIVSTVSLNRDEGQSAPTANATEHEWRRLRWKVGYSGFLGQVFVCILVSLLFLCRFSFLSCCLFRLLVGVAFGANSACYG